MVKKEDKNMKTVVVNHKMYEIQEDIYCINCMFYNTNSRSCKLRPLTIDCITERFIYVREIKFFERIKLWLKKKKKL